MTQRSSNHLGRRHDGELTSEHHTEELDKLLGRVRHHAVLLVSELARPPRVLRVRAGEVSLDVEWAQEHATAPGGGTPVTEADPHLHYLTSPTVGVFYRGPEPGAAPFVSEGDTVVAGQQVGIIEAMKLMIPVEAEQAGRVVEVLKDNAEPVEYDERLFAFTAVGGQGRAE